MRFGIRVATSPEYGAGHVTRSCALAAALPKAPVVFTDPCQGRDLDMDGVEEASINSMALSVEALRRGEIAALVVDHYSVDSEALREATIVGPIIRFRDGPPYGPEQLSIDVNPGAVGDGILAGPQFMPLDGRYCGGEIARSVVAGDMKILIGFGKRDSGNITGAVLDAVVASGLNARITVAIGGDAPHAAQIAARSRDIGATLLVDAVGMQKLYDEHDLGIGAPGISQFERARRGLPSILVAQNERQLPLVSKWAETGAAIAASVEKDSLCAVFSHLSANPRRLVEISRVAQKMVDGKGAARLSRSLTTWAETQTREQK
jgi:spore coat polysaccharide biosynthesis predicted glycosyltransferase SpsG